MKAPGNHHDSTTAYSAFPPPKQKRDHKDFIKTNKFSSQNASIIHSVDSTRAKNRVHEHDEVVSSYQDHYLVEETVNYGVNQRNSACSQLNGEASKFKQKAGLNGSNTDVYQSFECSGPRDEDAVREKSKEDE